MRSLVFITLLTLPALRAQEKAPDAAVVELRATIAKIVDTEALRSHEAADWSGRKAEMTALLDVQKRELALLSEELEKAGTSAGGFDERKQDAETELKQLKEVRHAVKQAVVRSKPRVLALVKQLPDPLAKEVEIDRIALDVWTDESEAREGLQAMLGIVAKAEQFNRRVTRSIEQRDGREVEVIYLGLARGYYADRSGNAGVGSPGKEGWNWESRPDLSESVRSAFDQLDRKRPPEVVELPVRIDGKGGAK